MGRIVIRIITIVIVIITMMIIIIIFMIAIGIPLKALYLILISNTIKITNELEMN